MFAVLSAEDLRVCRAESVDTLDIKYCLVHSPEIQLLMLFIRFTFILSSPLHFL